MRNIVPLILAAIPAIVWGKDVPNDTITAQELHEIVIKAPRVIHKADMDTYYPSQSAVDNSKNGVQLLSNLMIPSITVTEALGTITSAGQSVQVRINGREATVEQVRNLLPETIKRVEWIVNPGLRYNGANTVLNFIVTNPEVGGSLMLAAQPAFNAAWGYYNANAKFNFGRSQFEIGSMYKLTENLKMHRSYSETFRYPDDTSLTRVETPRGGNLSNTFGNFSASYSFIKPDTTVVVVEAYGFHKFSDKWDYLGLMSNSNGTSDILLTDNHGDRGTTPTFSAYWEQHFANRQTLVVDFKSQFYFGKSYSDYVEEYPDRSSVSANPITDIHTNIKDRNQFHAIEADYIKNWKKSRLTAGASYTANRNRSLYKNMDGQIFHQRQDKVYFFAEYFQRINKVTLTAGLGAQYTDILFRETNLGSHSWNLRPNAAVTYAINQKHLLRLTFDSWQSTPSLSETNPTPQQIDGFQWRIGNPDIKTSNSYMLTLRYNFQIPRVYGQFGVRAYTSPNAITPLLEWQGNKLVTTYENSRGLKYLTFFLSPQIEIAPKWLMISGYLEWRTERMRSTGYDLTNSAWSGNASLQLTHWGFTLMGQYRRAQRDLWGEKISWGEDLNIVELSYNWKQWRFAAGCIMPFGGYDQGSKSLSYWNTNDQHMRMDMRMPYISIDYNLQWGRQKRGADKLIDAGGSVDQSKAGGR